MMGELDEEAEQRILAWIEAAKHQVLEEVRDRLMSIELDLETIKSSHKIGARSGFAYMRRKSQELLTDMLDGKNKMTPEVPFENVIKFVDLKVGDLIRTHDGETAKIISSPSKSETRGKMRIELLMATGPRAGKGTWSEKCPDADVTLIV